MSGAVGRRIPMQIPSFRLGASSSLVASLALSTVVAAAASGCTTADGVGTSRSETRAGTSSSIRRRENFEGPRRVLAREVPSAIDILPRNGTLFDESAEGLQIPFRGFVAEPSLTIEIQVLTDSNLAITEENWITIATTQASSTPTQFNDPKPIFLFETSATPVPSSSSNREARARFPSGGLLRWRAIAVDGTTGARTNIPFFDEGTATNECLTSAQNRSWTEVLAQCASPFSFDLGTPVVDGAKLPVAKAATLVSIAQEPGRFIGSRPPPFLNRKGEIRTTDTDDYYNAINAPRTLDEFKSRFGFTNGGGIVTRDIEATYYNLGDLGIGREMHCTSFPLKFGAACYVNNYGLSDEGKPDFGGDPGRALADAVDRVDSFATVAMVKLGTRFTATQANDVQFFVYNGKGALVNAAPLDTTEQNPSIPSNCLNCHGGRYDRLTRSVRGATLLPFDPEAFLFASRAGFTYSAQEDRIRELNVLVRNSGAPPPVVALVDGWYDGNSTRSGQSLDLDFIPVGWKRSREAETVYREVVKPYCRTCHVSQVADFAFLDFESFKAEKNELVKSVCGTNEMPIAQATMSLFWRSPARAHVLGTLGLSNGCEPVRR
jgi:hypothetical protein